MRLREARERAGLTQTELAKRLGVKSPSVSWWESGRWMPKASRLRQIADVLGVTVDELLD